MHPARALAAAIEPMTGQVYFSPECHERYEALGFGASPSTLNDVAMPDGMAYFCSRGSCLGQAPGEVVASAFGVFNPAIVVPLVAQGWTLTDAATIAAARTDGAVGQLRRILGDSPVGLDRATELLVRANDGLRPEGRALFAGLLSLGLPGDPLGDAWRLADRLREYRGDVHIAAWTGAGFDATEIGLLTELYWGLPMKSYVRSRAWSEDELDAGIERVEARGLVAQGDFTDRGREVREDVEVRTDAMCQPILDNLGDDVDELVALLSGYSVEVVEAHGYPGSGPHDLAQLASSRR